MIVSCFRTHPDRCVPSNSSSVRSLFVGRLFVENGLTPALDAKRVDYSDPFVFGPEFAIDNVPPIIIMNLSIFPFLLWHLVAFHHLRFPKSRSGHRNLTQRKAEDFVEKVCHTATTEMLASPGVDIFVPSLMGVPKSFRMGWSSKISVKRSEMRQSLVILEIGRISRIMPKFVVI